MKKRFLLAGAIGLSVLTSFTAVHAQSAKSVNFITDPILLEKLDHLTNPVEDVNLKAARNLRKFYPAAEDAQWYTLDGGYAARFNDEGNKHIAFFGKHGGLEYDIAYEAEKDLPKEVRDRVKSVYYDYQISGVEEITSDFQTVYLIHMQDANTWKKVLVTDEDMKVIEDFNKF